jgi:hypothetical protein
MKKARMMLTAIVFFATIGGVLASNINNRRIIRIFYRDSVSGAPCTIQISLTLTLTIAPAGIDARLSTAPTTAPCPVIRVTVTI